MAFYLRVNFRNSFCQSGAVQVSNPECLPRIQSTISSDLLKHCLNLIGNLAVTRINHSLFLQESFANPSPII